jgi:hypothetical protein
MGLNFATHTTTAPLSSGAVFVGPPRAHQNRLADPATARKDTKEFDHANQFTMVA